MSISQTRQTILTLVGRRGSLSADAIAHAVGLSKMATRYHLRLLSHDGLIVACRAQHGRQVGRPETLYALAEEGYDCLPCQSNQLANHLLDSLLTSAGDEPTRALLRQVGREQALQATPLHSSAPFDARLTRAVRFLNRRGYASKAIRQGGANQLVISNCPYRQVARAHPQVCEMDIEMVRTLLDAPVSLSADMATRPGKCQFVIGQN